MPQREILSQHIFCFVVIAWVVSAAGANRRLHLLAGDNCYLSSMSLGTSFGICISIFFSDFLTFILCQGIRRFFKFCCFKWKYFFSLCQFFSPLIADASSSDVRIHWKQGRVLVSFVTRWDFVANHYCVCWGKLKAKSWWLLSFVKACDKCCVFSLCVFFTQVKG